jgi:hypothetical protein
MAKKKSPKKKVSKERVKKAAPRKPAHKKPARKKKVARSKSRSGKLYGTGQIEVAGRSDNRAERAGQSGDDQGLSDRERADSESVEELNDEGQSYEAEVVQGVEDAPDADVSEVKTHEVPEDDVPSEYSDGE